MTRGKSSPPPPANTHIIADKRQPCKSFDRPSRHCCVWPANWPSPLSATQSRYRGRCRGCIVPLMPATQCSSTMPLRTMGVLWLTHNCQHVGALTRDWLSFLWRVGRRDELNTIKIEESISFYTLQWFSDRASRVCFVWMNGFILIRMQRWADL